MAKTLEKRLAQLQHVVEPLALTDTLPHAGRKLAGQYVAYVLEATQDADDLSLETLRTVQQAARRGHHVFRLLEKYYTAKTVNRLEPMLAELAQRAEGVLMWRTLLDDMRQHHATLDADAAAFGALVAHAEKLHQQAEKRVTKTLSSKDYRKFVKRLTKFVRKGGKGEVAPETASTPFEVRHMAPVLLHEHLATVRGYDALVTGDPRTGDDTLTALYVDVLYLQDVIAFFADVLGKSMGEFSEKLDALCETLEAVREATFAQAALTPLESDAATVYLDGLNADAADAIERLPQVWESTFTRTSLRKFADALLVLR